MGQLGMRERAATHRGTAEIGPRASGGYRVRVRIPLGRIMSDNSSTIRVLIVDDQHMVRSGFSMMLSVEDDVDVVGEAPNGQVALEKARELRPDVILMDVQMPVMDGIEATGRSSPRTSRKCSS